MKRSVFVLLTFFVFVGGFSFGQVARFDMVSAYQGQCRTFPETGKQVCGRFLEYWQTNGGLSQQGLPISNEFVEVSDLNGQSYTVQYFERAVFEKHPENRAPFDVLLSQLGTFQFKRKYPNGEPGPGQPQPTARPNPTTPPASGALLTIQTFTSYKLEYSGPRVIGIAANTSGTQLGAPKIVATLKDAGGKIVATESDSGPGGMMPGDIWPFEVTFLSDTPAFTSIDFQIEAKAAGDFERRIYYRDYQTSDVNIVPSGSSGVVKIVGTVRNSGTSTGSYPQVYAAITDNAGQVIDVEYNISEITTLAPGQSSPFSLTMNRATEVPNLKIVVYSTKQP